MAPQRSETIRLALRKQTNYQPATAQTSRPRHELATLQSPSWRTRNNTTLQRIYKNLILYEGKTKRGWISPVLTPFTTTGGNYRSCLGEERDTRLMTTQISQNTRSWYCIREEILQRRNRAADLEMVDSRQEKEIKKGEAWQRNKVVKEDKRVKGKSETLNTVYEEKYVAEERHTASSNPKMIDSQKKEWR